MRHIFPIHATNNAFGGSAVFQDVYNVENFFLNRLMDGGVRLFEPWDKNFAWRASCQARSVKRTRLL